ncbi:GTP-binding protein REM 2-like [Limulus polyphemus]|uniref:GTP-binding protein REM 2-like n=1 Tax=Limulus polyphemus TaxID=6850 RepID=A0ABM1RX59_LIMPO|nr:GTP-binding protein REM 2-like [Limulus polyphemus]
MTLVPNKRQQNSTLQLYRGNHFAHSVPDLWELYRSPTPASTSSNYSRKERSPFKGPSRVKSARKKSHGVRTELRGPCQSRIMSQSGLSPARSRMSSAWIECDIDPWAQFRRRANTIPDRLIERLSRSMGQDTAVDCYRCRSFSVTHKGVMNLGDMVRYRSRSNVSETSGSSDDIQDRACSVGPNSPYYTASQPDHYNVALLGTENVGKSCLISQFMTSEYLTPSSDSRNLNDRKKEQNVSILLDREETELQFEQRNSPEEWSNEESFAATHAFVVVYSIADRRSFQAATRTLTFLKYSGTQMSEKGKGLTSKAVILVANKADLARCRVVSKEEGRCLASKLDTKFVETSTAVNYNVDELLVGIVKQIRLRLRINSDSSDACRSKMANGKARGLMSKLLHICESKIKSCDNLNII